MTTTLYQRIITTARDREISATTLPDFIGAELPLLDQEEISDSDIAQVASESLPEPGADGAATRATQTAREVTIRIGQYKFARGVLANCGHHCAFCGFSPGPLLVGRKLLRASHIKPWRDADNAARVDVRNGLAACPTHDAAFDTGLLLVTDDLKIEISPVLGTAMANSPSLSAVFSEPILAKSIILPAEAQRPKVEFLTWHRIKIGTLVPEHLTTAFDWTPLAGGYPHDVH